MSLQSEQVQIGDCTYAIGKLPARVGVRTAALLMNVIAPSVKALPVEGFKLENEAQLAALLEPLFSNPELGDKLDVLCATFAERCVVTTADGKIFPLSKIFDEHFSDNLDGLTMWLYHSVRVSMSSFLRGASALGALLPKVAPASSSKSPS